MNHSNIAAVADRLKNLKIFLQKTTPVISAEIDENLEGDIGFFFECCVGFTELLDFQECNFSECSISNHLIKNIQAGDGYCYIYHTKNTHKKSVTAIYKCNCRIDSVKKPRKHLEKEKLHDTAPRLNRYDCNGNVSIQIDIENKLVTIKINHQLLHPRPENIAATNEIKEYITNNLDYTASELYKKIVNNKMDGFNTLTVDQVYYWWSKANMVRYKRDDSESLSAQLYIAANKNRDMRSVLTKWFLCLLNHGIDNVKIFLSDKDFAQISSAQAVWKNVNVQLCKWHVNRAIKQKLSSSKVSSNISYNAIEANQQCSFIDPTWTSARNLQLSNQKTNSKVFCVQFYRNIILELVEKQNNLFDVWCYLE